MGRGTWCLLVGTLWLAAPLARGQGLVPADLPPPAAQAGAPAGDAPSGDAADPPNLALRNTLIIGTGFGLVAAYGLTSWWEDGFSGGFKSESEGWFAPDTEYAGIDKLGHFYATVAGVRLLAPLFEAAGNDHRTSSRLAALSTAITFALVEVVDGYSTKFTFSPEDLYMDLAGTAFGYVLETHPRLDAVLDFRLDYRRAEYSERWDPFSDYEGQRFLLVAKAEGIPALERSRVARYLEVAIGYGVEGYDTAPGLEVERKRSLYFGLSLNLSRLLADTVYDGRRGSTRTQRAADLALELVQLPTIVYGESEL